MVALVGVAAGAVAWGVGHLMLLVGHRLGFVDRPDDPSLKVHQRPAVPLGGIAVFAGFLVGSTLGGVFDGILIGLAAFVLTLGLIDDRISLPARIRLSAEVALAVLTVASDTTPFRIDHPLEAVIGVALIVVAINAVNLFDGLDALAGSASLVTFAGLAGLAALRGLDALIPVVLGASVAGFLLLNRPPAKLFLGDNGSYLVGFLLAITILRVSPSRGGIGLAIAALALGVFLLDLSVTVLRRRLAGRPVFAGDRSHLYDRLHDRGWSVVTVAVAASVAQALFIAAALAMEQWWPSWWAVLTVGAVCLILVVALARRSLSDLSSVSG